MRRTVIYSLLLIIGLLAIAVAIFAVITSDSDCAELRKEAAEFSREFLDNLSSTPSMEHIAETRQTLDEYKQALADCD